MPNAPTGPTLGDREVPTSWRSVASFLNGFSSDPVCAVTPAPEVVFFQAGPLCDIWHTNTSVRCFLWGRPALAHDHHPNTGTLVISARICSFTCPHRGFSHEGAPLVFRMPLCLGVYVDSPTP
ncbi:hypothetical protein PAPYR_11534 [Paratrimastix pyriformis]|uniref:Uncharacterized protein n=1 Tax=Paratrimastix pyriformis TaxID=342808 RepID=A0ABQ8U3J3_9EUKA|nr:hypothetical protein PAPYR_11534 [Paratrimastix pyriformis]